MGEGTIIFVTVGTGNTYGFERLIKKMDEIAGKINEDVVMQIGCTEYIPKNAKYFLFVKNSEMDELYKSSRVVVCHAGIGSIITAMKFNKPTAIVPRIKKYKEHIDDHQVEISKEIGREGLITVVYDVENLDDLLSNFSSIIIPKIKTESNLTNLLKAYLNNLDMAFVNKKSVLRKKHLN